MDIAIKLRTMQRTRIENEIHKSLKLDTIQGVNAISENFFIALENPQGITSSLNLVKSVT